MKRKGLRWRSILFMVTFVFAATLTMTVESPANEQGCCIIPCQLGCAPPSVQGRLFFSPPHPPICIYAEVTDPCHEQNCICY